MEQYAKYTDILKCSDTYDLNCKNYRDLVGKNITKFSFRGENMIKRYHAFVDNLIEYFSSIEEYEKCSFLLKIKKSDG